MVRTLLLASFVIPIIACTYIGSQTSLSIVGKNGWEIEYSEYVFRDEGVIISIPEVVIAEHGSAIGPIIPIIPINDDRSYESNQMELLVRITGFPNPESYSPSTVEIAAFTDSKSIPLVSKSASLVAETTKNNKEGKLWVQYSLRLLYDIRLGQLNQLSLNFILPMFESKISTLRLTKKENSDNEFILSPGV